MKTTSASDACFGNGIINIPLERITWAWGRSAIDASSVSLQLTGWFIFLNMSLAQRRSRSSFTSSLQNLCTVPYLLSKLRVRAAETPVCRMAAEEGVLWFHAASKGETVV